jgi:hypothetical protein
MKGTTDGGVGTTMRSVGEDVAPCGVVGGSREDCMDKGVIEEPIKSGKG